MVISMKKEYVIMFIIEVLCIGKSNNTKKDVNTKKNIVCEYI